MGLRHQIPVEQLRRINPQLPLPHRQLLLEQLQQLAMAMGDRHTIVYPLHATTTTILSR